MLWMAGLVLMVVGAQGVAKVAPSVPGLVPAFSGTWNLNLRRSVVQGGRPDGGSQAVIEYDGRVWRLRHVHSNRYGQVEDTWDTKLMVGSKVFQVARDKETPLTFRSRIRRDGEAMVLDQLVTMAKGGRARNTIRYTLEDGGNTLVEVETSMGVMGKEVNRWVLERDGTGAPVEHSPGPAHRED